MGSTNLGLAPMSHKLTILPYLIKFVPSRPNLLSSNVTVYGFDLDHTIIQPKTKGSRFSRRSDDWQFMEYEDHTTLDKLLDIVQHDSTAVIVIFSNQGGVVAAPPTSKSCTQFTNKIKLVLEAITSEDAGELLLGKVWIYVAPKKPAFLSKKSSIKQSRPGDIMSRLSGKITKRADPKTTKLDSKVLNDEFSSMRKPDIGMMQEFERDLCKASPTPPKIEWKYYSGDAAGRPKDFSDSDKVFAERMGVRFIIPEDVFM